MAAGPRASRLRRSALAAAALLARQAPLPAAPPAFRGCALPPPGCAQGLAFASRAAAAPGGAAAWRGRPAAGGAELAGRRGDSRGRAAAAGGERAAAGAAEAGRAAEDVVEQVAAQAAGQVKSLASTAASLERQLRDPAEAEEWMAKGNGLQRLPKSQWRRGMTEVEVSDWARLDASGQPGKILVQLDGKKSFQDNAKACFKQARKIMNSHEKVGPMLKEKRAELECWRVHAEKAAGWKEEAGSSDGLSAESATLVLELYDAMLEQGIIKVKLPPVAPLLDLEEEQRLAFKRKYGKDIDCYRTPGGHEVIAGRSSKMNDYVSTKLAKGDMMWFHTDRGIPGSHVLIKAPWSEISEEDVEFAARLAAYHSKAKDDHHVPVMYCAGGSVRKPKGARTGQVTCTGRTYSIVVTPGHPDDA